MQEKQGDENTSSGSMENVMDEVIPESIGRKFNETIEKENTLEEKLDINKADGEDLTRIPGIKKETAEKIIGYREKNGKIKNLDELKKRILKKK